MYTFEKKRNITELAYKLDSNNYPDNYFFNTACVGLKGFVR